MILPPENSANYLKKSKSFFNKHAQKMVRENHMHHNMEPNFIANVIEPLLLNPARFSGTRALEYGCGAGRNLVNLLAAAEFERVDGLDISGLNAANAQRFAESKFGLGCSVALESDGFSCLPFASEKYSYVISHQVFIHIPSREVRLSILRDIHRILVPQGVSVIHFKSMTSSVSYERNYDDFPKNVTIEKSDFELMTSDFYAAGFQKVSLNTDKNYVDGGLEVFATAEK